MLSKLNEPSHRRLNILTEQWVQVSPHRANRPWKGQSEYETEKSKISYDSTCYLCPSNKRAGGKLNPNYKEPFCFSNDFVALQYPIPEINLRNGLLSAKSEQGIYKVICFSLRHNLTLAELEASRVRRVIQAWIEEHKTVAKGSSEFIDF